MGRINPLHFFFLYLQFHFLTQLFRRVGFHFLRIPTHNLFLALVSWNEVKMEMENSLPCCFAIVLHQIVSVTSQHLRFMCDNLLGKLRRLPQGFILNLIKICIMLLRQNQGVSFRRRACVQDNAKILILIYGIGGNDPICQFTKSA